MAVSLFYELKLLTGKLKCMMHDASHSNNANNQQDIVMFCFPIAILKDEYVSHTFVYNGSCNLSC
jgi:hypothetical protein